MTMLGSKLARERGFREDFEGPLGLSQIVSSHYQRNLLQMPLQRTGSVSQLALHNQPIQTNRIPVIGSSHLLQSHMETAARSLPLQFGNPQSPLWRSPMSKAQSANGRLRAFMFCPI